jgi:hypothetical protein
MTAAIIVKVAIKREFPSQLRNFVSVNSRLKLSSVNPSGINVFVEITFLPRAIRTI